MRISGGSFSHSVAMIIFLDGIPMKPKKRQKLCYNCEGEVDLDVIVCPFCAADLREEKPEQQRSSFSASAHSVKQLGGTALYPPPRTEEPIYTPPTEELIMPREEAPSSQEESSDTKTTLIATALFTFGAQLFLLGVFLLLFQTHGALILKWDARLWFLYVFASVPLLLFGYRALSRI